MISVSEIVIPLLDWMQDFPRPIEEKHFATRQEVSLTELSKILKKLSRSKMIKLLSLNSMIQKNDYENYKKLVEKCDKNEWDLAIGYVNSLILKIVSCQDLQMR